MADTIIGKITHYYDKIGVAVIKVTRPLAVGETIKIIGHGKEFTQTVSSMQMEHKEITKAKKGQIIGLKLDQLVKKGDEVLKVKL